MSAQAKALINTVALDTLLREGGWEFGNIDELGKRWVWYGCEIDPETGTHVKDTRVAHLPALDAELLVRALNDRASLLHVLTHVREKLVHDFGMKGPTVDLVTKAISDAEGRE